MKQKLIFAAFAAVLALPAVGCRVVAPHQREYLSDPTMQAQPNALEARSRRKVHTAREGAAGGDGKPAGGGCGCSN